MTESAMLAQVDQAIAAAFEAADTMLDRTLGQDRKQVVELVQGWHQETKHGQTAATPDLLRRIEALSGAARTLGIDYVSATWTAYPDRLRELAPLALSDPIAADAVLGGIANAQLAAGTLRGARLDRLQTVLGVGDSKP